MIAVIDNYDSFTYNLVQYLGTLGAEIEVHRNDAISVGDLAARPLDGLVISPGPGEPRDAGISEDAIRALAGQVPILGVCLGHQAIGEVYGGRVVRAARLMHGKTSPILHKGRGLFAGLDNPFEATRYHSLIVERDSVPAALEIVDDLHRPHLGRTRNRAGGKARAHDVERFETGAAAAAHVRHQVHHLRVALDRHVFVGLHRPVLRHASDVVPAEVDEHHVLGALLVARAQLVFHRHVFVAVAAARARARDRTDLDDAVGAPDQHLG